MDRRRQQLDDMTRRWRERHDARRLAGPPDRPPADAERETRARGAFPYRELSPREYAQRHGADMIGFIYDEYAYDDPELDAWLVELGAELRRRRAADG
jgi:hypothetical protein